MCNTSTQTFPTNRKKPLADDIRKEAYKTSESDTDNQAVQIGLTNTRRDRFRGCPKAEEALDPKTGDALVSKLTNPIQSEIIYNDDGDLPLVPSAELSISMAVDAQSG